MRAVFLDAGMTLLKARPSLGGGGRLTDRLIRGWRGRAFFAVCAVCAGFAFRGLG